jgi:hypothetical protein
MTTKLATFLLLVDPTFPASTVGYIMACAAFYE